MLRENLLAEGLEKGFLKIIKHKQMSLAIGVTLAGGLLLTSVIFLQRRQLNEKTWQMLAIAQSQIAQGQLSQGISTLNELTSRYHSGAVLEQAYHLLGSAALAQGNPQQAVTIYEEGLALTANENNRPLLMIGLGTAYEEGGDLNKAAETYERFLKDFPDHFLTPRILLNLVRVRALSNNLDAARQSYEKLLTLYPDTPWTKRAGAYLSTNPPQKQPNS